MAQKKSVKPMEGPKYSASKGFLEGGVVHVEATGANATGGFQTHFVVDFTFAPPEELEFVNIPPSGIAADHVAPFTTSIGITLPENAKAVTIHDTQGAIKSRSFLMAQ